MALEGVDQGAHFFQQQELKKETKLSSEEKIAHELLGAIEGTQGDGNINHLKEALVSLKEKDLSCIAENEQLESILSSIKEVIQSKDRAGNLPFTSKEKLESLHDMAAGVEKKCHMQRDAIHA